MNKSQQHRRVGYLIREWLGDQCPICKGAFVGHHYTRTGVVVAESKSASTFVAAFRKHQWNAIRPQEFISSLDALVGNIVQCSSGKLAWFITFEPYDVFGDPYYVAELEVLDEEDSIKLNCVINSEEWREMPTGWLMNKRVLALKLRGMHMRSVNRMKQIFM